MKRYKLYSWIVGTVMVGLLLSVAAMTVDSVMEYMQMMTVFAIALGNVIASSMGALLVLISKHTKRWAISRCAIFFVNIMVISMLRLFVPDVNMIATAIMAVLAVVDIMIMAELLAKNIFASEEELE